MHDVLVPRVGIEPTTLGLEVLCSCPLSYRGIDYIIARKVTAWILVAHHHRFDMAVNKITYQR